MGHIPEHHAEHFLTVEDADINTHKRILMSMELSYQVFDTDVVVELYNTKMPTLLEGM